MAPLLPSDPSETIAFGPFRLDLAKRRLLRGEAPIDLRRKAWDVLRYLCQRPGVVVTTDELFDAVWPDVTVTPQTVTNVIRELRVALADTGGAPRWIQTLRGRGHVFRGPTGDEDTAGPAPLVVGRARERARLEAHWSRALRGEPQLVFVTGEPGIGKTTLVDDLAGRLRAPEQPESMVGRGACLEQHGRPESLLPFLTAIEQIATGPRMREVGATLRRAAPSWTMRLPHLLRPDERMRIAPSLAGATATRLLREGLGCLRTLAEIAPLVIIVEDLHWADHTTLDFVAALARSPAPFRLLLIATLRPVDAAIHEHPITLVARELARERHAVEMALAPFDEAAIGDYLHARLGAGARLDALVPRLDALSAGNPLFLHALVDDLAAGGAFVADSEGWRLADDADRLLADLPESLRAFVATEAARLPASLRRVVEAASVVGAAALVPELALTLEQPPREVADACEALASVGRLLRRDGEATWHDGSAAGRYAFPHASHRRIVYDALPTHYRQALHRTLALGLERAYGTQAPAAAARLAAHFDEGGLGERTVDYLELAAGAAEARFAYGEAAAHITAALARLDAAAGPAGDRSPRAGLLAVRLGELLVLANGYSQPEVEGTYRRALDIFERGGIAYGIFTAEMGLGAVDLTRARYRAALARTQRLATIATGEHAALAPIVACWAAFASSGLGDLTRARRELEAALGADDTPGLPQHFSVPRMLRSQLALVLTVQGDLTAARAHEDDARARGRQHGAVSEHAHAELLAAERAVFLGDPRGIETTSAAIALAEVNGLVSYLALLRVYDAALHRDWPPEQRIAVMRAALAERGRLGDRWHTALLLGLLAEVELESGAPDRARACLDEAFAHIIETEERYYEAELCRVRAECALASPGGTADALRWLERAIGVAREQGARLWEERATTRYAMLAPSAARR